MVRQCFQRWNWARLSAPISHTKRRFGQRLRSARKVSTVYTEGQCCSIAVTRMGARRACRRADFTRAASGAMPSRGFNGLPGDTSHQASSSPSAAIANSVMRRWPPCAGLKLPPSSPVTGPFIRLQGAALARTDALRAGSARCRVPATCRSSVLRERPVRAHEFARWRSRFPHQGQIRRHQQTGWRR